jgi:hypothetical protein
MYTCSHSGILEALISGKTGTIHMGTMLLSARKPEY